MRVQEIQIRNYKALKDIKMSDIPGFATIVGANGTGKSTLIDVFNFLKDCLVGNVRTALQRRGGFTEVVSRGAQGEMILIELAVQLDLLSAKSRTVRYRIEIGAEEQNRPFVEREILQYRRGGTGRPYRFIDFSRGEGEAVPESLENFDAAEVPDESIDRERQALDSPDILAIKGLGQFKRFDAARQLRELIENWTVSDFHIDQARLPPEAGQAEHLSSSGDNLALVTQYLRDYHPAVLQGIIRTMSERVPGVSTVLAENTGDGRVGLRFKDGSFDEAFLARSVSDGTIKMFAYLMLLNDPEPHPLLCIEEPENQLYPALLELLAEEFYAYAERRRGQGQVFVTTHSPDFLNAVPLESIYWFEKCGGFSKLRRAAEDPQLAALVAEGDHPGELWRQQLFGNVDPR